MKLIILFIFLCAFISTVYLQDIGSNAFSQRGIENVETQVWPLQNVQKAKPCSERRAENDLDEHWIPSYSSRITHSFQEPSVLQPQALRNDADSDLRESENDLLVHNSPERRSFDSSISQVKEEDSIELPESTSQEPLANEETEAIKIIKDCVKQKEHNDVQEKDFGASRRSMSSDDVEEINELDDNDDQQDSEIESGQSRKAAIRITEIRTKDTLFNPRVCYACSTATNPSCWEPDRRTTVKYCTKEKSCVTKSLGVKNALTVIRDCADSCEDNSILGIEPKYNSCKVCHSDLCNGAFSINSYNLIIVLVISIAKCTF